MCTLTFFPLGKRQFVLTSNRDEQPKRKNLPPMEYNHDESTLIYPKDEKAEGTWIGANTNGRVASLMNGGKVPHVRKSSYRLSRGLVMKKLLQTQDVTIFFEKFNFTGIEAFTIILIDPQNQSTTKFKVYELIWDEEKLYINTLPWKPQIWSSTPLYTREVHQNRELWFKKFIKATFKITPEAIWDFHHLAGTGDKNNDLIMDRGYIHTKSITQFIYDGVIKYRYQDLS